MGYPPQGAASPALNATRAGYIDELAAANMPADLDDALAEIIEVEKHLHNRERWFGKLGSQTATDWGDPASLTPYRAISGNSDFGDDANDEALVIGIDDSPAISGMTRFDAHRLMIAAASHSNDWVLRIIYGTGTMAAAESANQYSDVMLTEAKKGIPVELIMPRGTCGSTKIWLRAKSATNNATIDFFLGIHEYEV